MLYLKDRLTIQAFCPISFLVSHFFKTFFFWHLGFSRKDKGSLCGQRSIQQNLTEILQERKRRRHSSLIWNANTLCLHCSSQGPLSEQDPIYVSLFILFKTLSLFKAGLHKIHKVHEWHSVRVERKGFSVVCKCAPDPHTSIIQV